MYVTSWCSYCEQARVLLDSLGLSWEEINIGKQGISRAELAERTGSFTVPR